MAPFSAFLRSRWTHRLLICSAVLALASQQSASQTPATPKNGTVSVQDLQVPDRAKESLFKSFDRYHKNDLQGALKAANQAVSAWPQYARALSFRGYLELKLNQLEAAQNDLEHALRINPGLQSTYLHLGTTLNQEGRYDDAILALNHLAAMRPDTWQWAYEKSKSLMGKKDYAGALELINQAETLIGAAQIPSEVHFVRAHALIGLQQYGEAIPELQSFLSAEPNGPLAQSAREMLVKIERPNPM